MKKITFHDFQRIMLYDITPNQSCIEIKFSVDHDHVYQKSWMGKMLEKNTGEVVYWFGLTEDGSQAYEYDTFESFLEAKIFNGKSIKDIWDLVTFLSIDACDVQERLPVYLGI